jgi:hypothetical protein
MKGDRVDSFNSFKYIADDRPMIPQELAYVLLMGKVSSDFVACRMASLFHKTASGRDAPQTTTPLPTAVHREQQ